MTRRMIFLLTALLGFAGVLVALASPASAQTGFPFVFDFSALIAQLTETFQRLAIAFPFLAGFLNSLLARIVEMLTALCGEFCSS